MTQMHFIDGEPVASLGGETLFMVSPVTGEICGQLCAGQAADAEAAVASARRAFIQWSATDPSERGRVLWRIADALEDSLALLAEQDSQDMGKPIVDAKRDAKGAADLMRFFAGLPDKVHGSTMQVQKGFHASTVREPYGVIAAIVPWNYPISNACTKVGAIIAMGNTCILKPAEQAPTSAFTLARLALEVGLPRGVLNVLQGDATAGKALVRSDGVDKVSFTGSTDAGRDVMETAAASNLKPCSLELGGKSPLIVFADADIHLAAEACAFSNFYNQGQTCTATTRVLVEVAVFDDFVQALTTQARRIQVGLPQDPSTDVGPLVSREQLAKVETYVQGAVDAGARVVIGGMRPRETGFFYTPTILTGVPLDCPAAAEEIFGPVATVIPFSGERQALEIANSIEYALGASVWSRDAARLQRVVQAINAGIVWGNCLGIKHPSVPVGGFGISGYGKEQGVEAAHEYTRLKSIWQASGEGIPYLRSQAATDGSK